MRLLGSRNCNIRILNSSLPVQDQNVITAVTLAPAERENPVRLLAGLTKVRRQYISQQVPNSEPGDPLDQPEGRHTANAIARQI